MDGTVRRAAPGVLLALAAMAPGCGERVLPPRGQLVLHFDTDAPTALSPGVVPDAGTPAPLFDRLRVEILDENGELACSLCARDFSVDQGQVGRKELSLGAAVPPGRSGLLVRARLF